MSYIRLLVRGATSETRPDAHPYGEALLRHERRLEDEDDEDGGPRVHVHDPPLLTCGGREERGERSGGAAGAAPSSLSESPLRTQSEDQFLFVGHVIDREEVEEDEEEPLRVAEVGEAREQEDEDQSDEMRRAQHQFLQSI